VIADLKPYPNMKDSGVPWLGEVPEHWALRRLRDTVHGCFNGVWGDEPNQRDDLVCVRVADFDRTRRRVNTTHTTIRAIDPGLRGLRLLKRGDLLIEKSGGGDQQPVGMVVLYDHDLAAVCSNFVARMPTKAEFDPGYLVYVHKYLYAIRLNVRSIKQTTGIQNLDSHAYLAESFAFPPMDEQMAIARFLQSADVRISRYIRAKQELIKLLEEQKQAVIQRAVTEGIDDDVALKPSGVPWLGEVPMHWTVWRSKRLFRPRKELARPGDVQLSATQAYGVIPQADYEARIARKVTKINLHLEKRRHVEVEDFVISMRSFQGGLERAWSAGCIRSSYVVLQHADDVDVDFFSYLFKSRAYIGALQSTANFIRDGQDLNFDNFAAVDLAVPPLEEQKRIAQSISDSISTMPQTAERARREIALLNEYRERLIADVVTGKVDVRQAAARLPEETDEPKPSEDVEALAKTNEKDEDADLETVLEEVEA
jgi:type I restriction enzyme S subunit